MLAEAANATNTERSAVIGAIQRAASATGADFNYLLGTAMRESSLKPGAKASSSSAAGLYQFVDQTWLGMVKNYGAKYGLSSYAHSIRQGSDGRYHADNSADRSAILALRKDPQIAALMEGEYAQSTRATLQGHLGRDVCGGELYAAHFLGPDAACRLIRMSENQPDASAAHAFPAAADSNRSVFFHSNGTAKTVREVYDWAMKQPGGKNAVASSTVSAASETGPVVRPATGGDDSETLLASFAAYRPSHGFFSTDSDDNDVTSMSTPSMAFAMSPGILDALQAMN
ncbi:MAG TPA: hypothetical protein VG387_02630 [Rhizomicrobium sp.]|jgi:hypothetical protein|nr:hypothetical protein [Rhizomicrobium sp.]